MNVLISAYAVSPNHGSEPGVGWNLVLQLMKHCKLFVITEAEFKNQIEEATRELPQRENLIFYFNDIGDNARKMCWNQGDYRFYFYYRKWQKKTLTIAERIISEHRIDIIHQLNMIGYREPGYLWKIKRIPFVWGPIGGFNFVKTSFLPSLGFKNASFYILKNTLNLIQALTNLRVHMAVNRASLLFAATKNSQTALKRFYNKESILMNETGCQILEIKPQSSSHSNKDKFRILWVGRFIPTKLLGVAIQSISKLGKLEGLEFHIVGDGNKHSLKTWKNYAAYCGIDDICHWHGKIAHSRVQDLMRSSDLLFFTSIVEGTPHVILEATTNSLPILCFETCGQGEIVTPEIGRKIPLKSPKKSIQMFAEELERLYNDRALLAEFSSNSKHKALELSWEKKAARILQYYNTLTNDNP